ncbi:hypothetical protein FIBSPDRAFT_928499 [Athelia psychrophila]|uniref:RBR-type E3 ubiquitin transferase n=1 Tax=Athelia psychrophila TaxID=1759441 RepID=A0A166Q7E5_9AGAM|nr:hypothetical protein FIBSPDRAFT_928499 [Fibularhizoctonia sp. CBS 109695]
MASEGPPGKPQAAVPNNRTRSKRNNQTKNVQATDNLKLNGKCRFFIQGHCKFGDLCKRSHGDPPGEVTTSLTIRIPIQVPRHTSSTPATSSNVLGHPTTSSASTLLRSNAPITAPYLNPSPGTIPPKQAKKPCFSWAKSGTCQFGNKCRNDHDTNVPLRTNRESQGKAARIDEARIVREAAEAEAEFAHKVQRAQEEAAAELARQAALQQAEAERVRARAQHAKEQAGLLEWDRARRIAAAAEVAECARQEAVQQRARNTRYARIEKARRVREAAEAAQKVQEDAAQRAVQAEVCRAQEAQQEEARRVRQAEQEQEAAEAALRAQQAQEKAVRQAEARRVREARQEEAQRLRLAEQEQEEAEAALRAQKAQEEAAQQAEARRVREARQEEVQRVRLAEQEQEEAEAALRAQKAQEKAARQAEARRVREARQEEAHRLRQAEQEQEAAEAALRAQQAQEKTARRAEARRMREARQEEAQRVRQAEQEQEEAEAALRAQQAQEEAARQVEARQEEARRVRQAEREQEEAEAALRAQQAQEETARQAEARREETRRVRQAEREQEETDTALKAQQAQEETARRVEACRVREARQEEARREEARRVRQAEREREAAEAALREQQAREDAARRAEVRRAREAQQEEARRALQVEQEARMVELIKEEAAMTMQHIVLDFTVVTFSAGLAIQDVLLGFESCRITIKNLPIDATVKEVCELFTQQGIEPGRFHVLGLARTPAGKQEAFLIGHEDLKMVAIGLEEIDFRQERLSFEIMGHGGGDGMAASALDANTLTLTWRAPLNRLIEESLDASIIVPRTGDTGEAICPICYDVVTLPIKLGCGHAYCSACIRHFLTSASTFPLVCMGDEDKCHAPIPIPVVQRFLPIRQFTNLLETAFITHIDHHPQDFKYCTTPDCRQVYRCTTSDTASIIHCPSCLSSVCSACHEEGHEGMTCAERKLNNDPEEQERLNDELAAQSGYKKCPQCAVWIEKIDGCNHMECKCGAHICWVCMGIFDAQSVYEHMNTAHGGMHGVNGDGVEPLFQPEDFAEQQEVLRLMALRRAQLEQQQRQEAEDAQHFLAQQHLYARQLRQQEDARMQGEARRVELIRQMEENRAAEEHRRAEEVGRRETNADRQAQEQRDREEGGGWGCVVI